MLHFKTEIDLVDYPDGIEKKFLNYTLKCKLCCNICIPALKLNNSDSHCMECKDENKGNWNEVLFSAFEENEILPNIFINCKFLKRGCSTRYNYLDSLKYYDKHIKTCPYTPIKCDVCMLVFNSSDFPNHKQICKFESCEKCQNKMIINEDHDCIISLSNNLNTLRKALEKIETTLVKRNKLPKIRKNKKILKREKLKIVEEKVKDLNSNMLYLEGLGLYEANNFSKSKSSFEKAIELEVNKNGEENQEVIKYYMSLAILYEDSCLFSKAMDIYMKCQNIILRFPEGKHKIKELAKIKSKIGNFYSILNEYDKADKFLNESLNLRKQLCDSNIGEEIAISNTELGIMYIELANYKKAFEHLNEAENIYTKLNLTNTLGFADLNNGLGDLCYSKNEFKRSLDHYKKALEIKKKLLGENHLDISLIYNNIGLLLIYYDVKFTENALTYFEKALEIRLRLNKRYAAITYNDIGYNYYLSGNMEMALYNYNEAFKINNSLFGNDHKDVAFYYKYLALTEDKKRQYDSAIKNMEKAIVILKSVYGENHVNVANCYFEQGVIVSHYPKHQERSEFYYQKALEIRERIFNLFPHPDTSDIYCYIGLFHSEKGNIEKALENYRKCLKIRLLVYDEERNDTVAIAYRNVAISLIQVPNGKEESEKMLLKALEILRKVYGENHVEIANLYQDLGYYNEKIDNLKKGESYYKDALKLYKKLGLLDKSNMVYTKLGIIQIRMQKYEKAIRSLEKSLINQN